MEVALSKGVLLAALGATLVGPACTFDPTVHDGKIRCLTDSDCPAPTFRFCQSGTCHQQPDTGSPASTVFDAAVDVQAVPDAGENPLSNPTAGMASGPDVSGNAGVQTATPSWMVCPSVPAAPDATGLVLLLHLDEGPGQIDLVDACASKLEAALHPDDPAVSWIPGRSGMAVVLPGGTPGAWIAATGQPTPVALNAIADQFSISLWVRFIDGKAADGVLVSRMAAGSRGYLYKLAIEKNYLRAGLYTTNGYHADLVSDQTLPEDGSWIHVAMTYRDLGDGANPTGVRLFVNGVPFGQQTFGLPIGPENTPLIIGAAQDTSHPTVDNVVVGQLKAAIDEVLIYRRALNVAEIKALACGALPSPTVACR